MNLLYLFSTWIFIWSILYIFKVVPYTPVFALWCGILVEFIFIVSLILQLEDPGLILYLFISATLLEKIVPLYIIHETRITSMSVYSTCILFFIYLLVLLSIGRIYDVFLAYKHVITNPRSTMIWDQYKFIQSIF